VALLGFGLGASEGMTIVPMPFSALASVGCWGTSRAPLKFAGFGLERYLTIFFWKNWDFGGKQWDFSLAKHGWRQHDMGFERIWNSPTGMQQFICKKQMDFSTRKLKNSNLMI
jgi:hypothetical protein